MLVAWQDTRADAGDIYVQRIVADGRIASGWPEHGAAAGVAPGLQRFPVLVGDGRGGAIVAWQDERPGLDADIYAQLVRSDGTLAPGALAGGTSVCTAYGQQQWPRIVEDGAGGALIAWGDRRRDADIYAAHFHVDGVVATLTSLAVAEARGGEVRLEWTTARPSGSTAELSRHDGQSGWKVLATLEADASRRFVWRDRAVTPGQRYRYRLGERIDGVVEFTPEVEVLVPSSLAFAIEPVVPNPASGNVTIGFTVPEAGNARLEIVDLQGRIRDRQDLGALQPGRHAVGVALRGRLPAGVYWAQLAWRGETKRVRFAVVQ